MCQISKIPPFLRKFFEENNRNALAYSGGTDSTYLLYAAMKSGAETTAYTVRTAFQTAEEMHRAADIAEMLGAKLVFIDIDILGVQGIKDNPANRCYLCKRALFTGILERARQDGIGIVIDGTNASDDVSDRPGMRALNELNVVSPLRLAGLTKKQVRSLSKEANLPTWNIVSNSCLATRIPYCNVITIELLNTIKTCEDGLSELGFTDFRVRSDGASATVETVRDQRQLLEEKKADVESLLLKYHSSVSYTERTPHQ